MKDSYSYGWKKMIGCRISFEQYEFLFAHVFTNISYAIRTLINAEKRRPEGKA